MKLVTILIQLPQGCESFCVLSKHSETWIPVHICHKCLWDEKTGHVHLVTPVYQMEDCKLDWIHRKLDFYPRVLFWDAKPIVFWFTAENVP